MTSESERSAADRAARRAYIRAAHPDLGGDPTRFAEGLAAFDHTIDHALDHSIDHSGRPPGSAPHHPVRVVRSRRLDRVLTHTLRKVRRRLSGRPPRHLL